MHSCQYHHVILKKNTQVNKTFPYLLAVEQRKVSNLPDTTPKEGCQKEEKDKRKVLNRRGREEKNTKEADVYTFPADSEPESPPPGPWAHCTFIQRRRKKRAILRPFSGLGTWQRTTGAGRRTRGKTSGAKQRRKTTKDVGGMFNFKEEKTEKVRGRQNSVVDHQLDKDLSQEIFTCVECSIYFKKRVHLREHMREHGQVGRSGKKWQCGEKEAWSGHHNKNAFECIECGQEFVDKVLLLDHHRCHEESRQKILEEIGKLNKGEKQVAVQAGCSNASEPVILESTKVSCGQFVCLECNFSSDVAQELSVHAKTHTTRKRAGVYRTSPRFQQKSCKKGQVQSSADVTPTFVTSPLNKRYPIRASKKTKETQPDIAPSQVDSSSLSCRSASATPGEATDQPDKATLHASTDPAEESRQIGETSLANPMEKDVLQPQNLISPPPNPRAVPRRKDVALKSIGKKRSVRAAKDKLGRTRASRRLDPKSTLTTGVKKQVQISNQTANKGQKEDIPTPEPEHDPKQDSKTGKSITSYSTKTSQCLAGKVVAMARQQTYALRQNLNSLQVALDKVFCKCINVNVVSKC